MYGDAPLQSLEFAPQAEQFIRGSQAVLRDRKERSRHQSKPRLLHEKTENGEFLNLRIRVFRIQPRVCEEARTSNVLETVQQCGAASLQAVQAQWRCARGGAVSARLRILLPVRCDTCGTDRALQRETGLKR